MFSGNLGVEGDHLPNVCRPSSMGRFRSVSSAFKCAIARIRAHVRPMQVRRPELARGDATGATALALLLGDTPLRVLGFQTPKTPSQTTPPKRPINRKSSLTAVLPLSPPTGRADGEPRQDRGAPDSAGDEETLG